MDIDDYKLTKPKCNYLRRKYMRFARITLIFTVMITMVSGLVFAETVIDDNKNPEYLFTMASKSGKFEGDRLTLEDVPMVVYFTDRPVRKSGHMSLQNFVSGWAKGMDNFKIDPPNAELAIYDEKGDKHAVLIIDKPETKGDRISFKIKLIGETIPQSFGHSTLFIDSIPTLLNGQLTD